MVGHHQRDPQQPRVGDHRKDHHPGGAHVNHVRPARDEAREHAEADAEREKQRRGLVEGQPFEGFEVSGKGIKFFSLLLFFLKRSFFAKRAAFDDTDDSSLFSLSGKERE